MKRAKYFWYMPCGFQNAGYIVTLEDIIHVEHVTANTRYYRIKRSDMREELRKYEKRADLARDKATLYDLYSDKNNSEYCKYYEQNIYKL